MTDLELQLLGWRLITAEITYRMPDHLNLLQLFIWQEFDLAPKYPRLHKFLRFWQDNLDGPLYAVRVGVRNIISPAEMKFIDKEFKLL